MSFVPRYAIGFLSTEGLDREEFCTFRLHGTWGKKLKKGMYVYMLDNQSGMVVGKARVSQVYVGPLAQQAQMFGMDSHVEPLRVPKGYAQRRLESLRKIYGPNRVRDDSRVTVIYLKPTGKRNGTQSKA